jgi:hypothetical protein
MANGSKTKASPASGRKELQEIIATSEAIIDRKFNPFFLDVKFAIETIRKYFPGWKTFEDHCLDVRTLHQLAEVLNLQNSQLRFQSSAIYTNPELLKEKIKRISTERLAAIYLEAWHPTVELEQLTQDGLKEALAYWEQLLPYIDRLTRWEMGRGRPPTVQQYGDLVRQGMLTREEFAKQVVALWNSLKDYARGVPVEYNEFVRRDNYAETVERAYYLSFVVSFGYARLESRDGRLLIIPNEAKEDLRPELLISLPVSLRQVVGR